MDRINSIEEAYTETDRAYRIVESKIGCIVALILVPAGITLDYFIYPAHFVDFFHYRVLCDLFILAAYAAHFTEFGKKHIKLVTLIWLTSIQIMISYMIFSTDGYLSTYYAGMNLPLLAVGILLPTSIPEALLFSAITIVLYLTASLPSLTTLDEFHHLYNNLYFLALTSVISLTAVHFNTRRRFSEFRLSYELDGRNKELAELDRLKSQFFANVSHELRTPLTLILSPVQELVKKGTDLPPSVQETLRLVQANGFRLLRLVNDLLEVIRLEEGSERLAREPVDLNRVAFGQAEGIAHLAERKGLRLIREPVEGALVVSGDSGALEKIVLNLLNNAVKFTDEGGWVRLATRREGERAVVEVSDGGVGIPAEELPHIFDRFRQADGSSTRRYQGTGLGLSLVKELTEKLEGEVEAESRQGEGTTLRVWLPLTTEEPSSQPASALAVAADDALEALHRQAALHDDTLLPTESDPSITLADDSLPLLLVVDDEPDMRRYLRRELEGSFRVIEAGDGESGLALAMEQQPALILLDLMLPGMDGFEVTRRLRAEAALRNTRIILLTARDSEETKLRALDEGADDFVPKPFLIPELSARVRNLIDRAQLFDEVEEKNRRLSETLEELRAAEAHLIQSEKLNSLGSLAAGLLHEINNPLNFTMMALQVARAEPEVAESEELSDALKDIHEGMSRIHAIVRDLHAFAHPSAGDLEGRFAVAEAVSSALQFTAHELKELVVEKSIDEGCMAIGSRSHIVQVLINLIANAAKAVSAADRGESVRKIRILCKPEEDRLKIAVWDNGTGIPEAVLPRIFDPFFTTRDVGQGMGMGLSICHTIVRNHGGNLRAESSPGEWTEFTFDLPAAR